MAALTEITAGIRETGTVRFRLDTIGDDLHLQGVREGDNRPNHRTVMIVIDHLRNRTIKPDGSDREPAHEEQRHTPGPEMVELNMHTEHAEIVTGRHRRFRLLGEERFGDLQGKARRRNRRSPHDVAEIAHEGGIDEACAMDRHGECPRIVAILLPRA